MGCPIVLKGLANQCGLGMGGIKEIYVADRKDVKTVTVSDEVITAITMEASTKFYKYQLAKHTAGFESTLNVDHTAGSLYHETSLDFVFNKMNTAKRAEFKALSLGDLAVIALDSNGVYWYLGFDYPVNMSAGSSGTGVAAGDANQYAMTLTDISKEPPYEVSGSIVDALVA